MHYHPFAQNLLFPAGVFLLTGILQIPLTLITMFLANLFFGQGAATGM